MLIKTKSPTQGLDGTKLTAEKKHSINVTGNNKRFCLSLRYNGANFYLFVNCTEIHKFKAKHSEIVAAPLQVIATGFETTATYFVNQHSTI